MMNKYIEQEAIHYCNEVPFMRVLILCASYRQVKQYIDDFIRLVSESELECQINLSNSEVRFPNGSHISLGFCSKDLDVHKYAGCEYGFIHVDDAIESDFIGNYIVSRVRMRSDKIPEEYVDILPKFSYGSR